MSYKKLIKMVATEHSTTPENVDKEIRKAIKSAGYDMEPELFVSLITEKARKETSQSSGFILLHHSNKQ